MVLGVGILLMKYLFKYEVFFILENWLFSLFFFIANYSIILFIFKDNEEVKIGKIIIKKRELFLIEFTASVILAVLQFANASLTITMIIIYEMILAVIVPLFYVLLNIKESRKEKS